MSKTYDIAIAGATGAVGEALLQILEQRKFPVGTLFPLASERSIGRTVKFCGEDLQVQLLNDFDFRQVQLGLFSAGAAVSAEIVPRAVEAGAVVIDNTSQFHYDDDVPLVVPECNAGRIANYVQRGIIANPNCSTIQLVVALKPIQDAVGIERINVSTYQAVSGAGRRAIETLTVQTHAVLSGDDPVTDPDAEKSVVFNVVPKIDRLLDNGFTKEEMKMYHETKKIMNSDIDVSATCVRVPVMRAHSESIWCETEKPVSPAEFRKACEATEGITVLDDLPNLGYPMPLDLAGKDDVYVGRIRKDLANPNGITFWSVSDQIRKGAALNAVQIAEYLVENNLVKN